MTMWDWYVLLGLATAFAAVTHYGQISDSLAQILPSTTTKGAFNFWAVMMALTMGVAWPMTWWFVYDHHNPSQ